MSPDLSSLKVCNNISSGLPAISYEECAGEDLLIFEALEPKGRRNSRSLAFQLLYAVDRLDYDVDFGQLLTLYEWNFSLKITRDSFAVQLVDGAVTNRIKLQSHIEPLLENWGYERLDCITRLLLHMAVWELLYHKQTPFKSIIDEYVELSRAFGEAESYRFINGVLDKIII